VPNDSHKEKYSIGLASKHSSLFCLNNSDEDKRSIRLTSKHSSLFCLAVSDEEKRSKRLPKTMAKVSPHLISVGPAGTID
jgi:hypothetical protein